MSEKSTNAGALRFWGVLALSVFLTTSLNGTTLTATVWADEAYEVYVSHSDSIAGTLFLEGAGGGEGPQTGSAELIEGAIQYVHILVKDDLADPSALIGSFSLSDFGFIFPTFFPTFSTGETSWKVSRTGWSSNYEFMTNLGPNGTAPFGQKEGLEPGASYVWSDSDSGDRYFSFMLSPTNSTPRRFNAGVQPIISSAEGQISKTEGLPIIISYEDGPSRALAVSFPARVGARAEEYAAELPTDNYTIAWADFDSPDFVVTSSGNETEVDVSLNLHLKGVLKGGAGLNGLPTEVSLSSTEIFVRARVRTEQTFFGLVEVNARHEVGTSTPATEITKNVSGFLIGAIPEDLSGDAGDFLAEFILPIDQMVTTPTYTVPVNEPFSVSLGSRVISQAVTDQGQALSSIDFTGGWSFPTEGNAFNVPDGVTVNSISATIRDNVFEGDPASDDSVEGIFMRIDGIEGESVVKGREEWIDLLSASADLSRPNVFLRRSPPLFGDLMVTKYVDKSSAKLAEKSADGGVLPEVIVEVNPPPTGDTSFRFEYKLSDVIVSSYLVEHQQGEDLARDVVALNYSQIDWIYRIFKQNGDSLGRVEAYWDMESDSGGSSSSSPDNEPPSIDPVANQSAEPATTNTVDITVGDMESNPEDLMLTVSTTQSELIRDLGISGIGENLQISYTTSSLRSGFGSILVGVSDGTDTRTTSIPVLVGIEMTPFEGFLAANFGEENLDDPVLTSPIRDPDRDGIATVIEFLLGTNPNEFNHSSEAIDVAFTADDGGCMYTLDFKKRLDDPNVQGFFWVSKDLVDWERMDSTNPMYEETVKGSENPLYEEATAFVTFPDVCKDPIYIRYQVQDVF